MSRHSRAVALLRRALDAAPDSLGDALDAAIAAMEYREEVAISRGIVARLTRAMFPRLRDLSVEHYRTLRLLREARDMLDSDEAGRARELASSALSILEVMYA